LALYRKTEFFASLFLSVWEEGPSRIAPQDRKLRNIQVEKKNRRLQFPATSVSSCYFSVPIFSVFGVVAFVFFLSRSAILFYLTRLL
jgi:hypothetical protein